MTDLLQEKWIKGVAITTTILAVMTSIVSARSATCVSKIQILTAQEGSRWNYFQSKSIKLHLAEHQKSAFEIDLLGSMNAVQKQALEKQIRDLTENIKRYSQEKDQLQKEALSVGEQNYHIQRQNNQFVISVVFFQIAIMLSSVSALVKRPELWWLGIGFGFIAIFFFANGFFLFYQLPFVF